MNPLEQFVHDFKKLFPKATVNLSEENGENIIYHNVDLERISFSDSCALEHINDVLRSKECTYWLNYVRDE